MIIRKHMINKDYPVCDLRYTDCFHLITNEESELLLKDKPPGTAILKLSPYIGHDVILELQIVDANGEILAFLVSNISSFESSEFMLDRVLMRMSKEVQPVDEIKSDLKKEQLLGYPWYLSRGWYEKDDNENEIQLEKIKSQLLNEREVPELKGVSSIQFLKQPNNAHYLQKLFAASGSFLITSCSYFNDRLVFQSIYYKYYTYLPRSVRNEEIGTLMEMRKPIGLGRFACFAATHEVENPILFISFLRKELEKFKKDQDFPHMKAAVDTLEEKMQRKMKFLSNGETNGLTHFLEIKQSIPPISHIEAEAKTKAEPKTKAYFESGAAEQPLNVEKREEQTPPLPRKR